MRAVVLWVMLWAAPALAAGDDLAEMNAVSKAWDRYAELSSQDKAESVDLLAASSLKHFGFLRDAALYASPEQLRRIPASDRLMVYLLRTRGQDALAKLDDRAVAALCMSEGWAGTEAGTEERPIVALSHVTVLGDVAVGEVAPPTDSQFQFGPQLVREDGLWKYRYESMVPDTSAFLENSFKRSGQPINQLYEMVLSNLLKQAPPALAVLDRPLQDDAAARTRLNEQWPDYRAPTRHRWAAVRQKAEQGDGFAQYVMGLLMMSGETEFIARDQDQGRKFLLQSSEGGYAPAAWFAYLSMIEDSDYSDAVLAKALPHLRRAADYGTEPGAMVVLAEYYFDGVAGVPRDCGKAAEWYARAEEAGREEARNEQVWALATCPLPAQRAPEKALELAQYMMARKDELPWHELDTVAAALAANGRFEEAVGYQKLAVDKASQDADMKGRDRSSTLKDMKRRLSRYQSGRDYVVEERYIDQWRRQQ